MEELVFAFPTSDLWDLLSYKEKGLIRGSAEVLEKIAQNGLFLKRSNLEEDPSFKQIIPYAVLSNKDSFYLFKRTSLGAEKRLHNKYSLGVGGHMNPDYTSESDKPNFLKELKRECFEEVRFENECSIEDIEFIGFINDDTIPVGRVHIGLLYNIQLSNKEIFVNETDKIKAEWVDKAKLTESYQEMETWSRIAYDFIIGRAQGNGSFRTKR